MAVSALVDAGALLALLDQSDRWHQACADTLRQLPLPLATSEAGLTELSHLVGEIQHDLWHAEKNRKSLHVTRLAAA
jgi:predicted nucleic acid-binding protein